MSNLYHHPLPAEGRAYPESTLLEFVVAQWVWHLTRIRLLALSETLVWVRFRWFREHLAQRDKYVPVQVVRIHVCTDSLTGCCQPSLKRIQRIERPQWGARWGMSQKLQQERQVIR